MFLTAMSTAHNLLNNCLDCRDALETNKLNIPRNSRDKSMKLIEGAGKLQFTQKQILAKFRSLNLTVQSSKLPLIFCTAQ